MHTNSGPSHPTLSFLPHERTRRSDDDSCLFVRLESGAEWTRQLAPSARLPPQRQIPPLGFGRQDRPGLGPRLGSVHQDGRSPRPLCHVFQLGSSVGVGRRSGRGRERDGREGREKGQCDCYGECRSDCQGASARLSCVYPFGANLDHSSLWLPVRSGHHESCTTSTDPPASFIRLKMPPTLFPSLHLLWIPSPTRYHSQATSTLPHLFLSALMRARRAPVFFPFHGPLVSLPHCFGLYAMPCAST